MNSIAIKFFTMRYLNLVILTLISFSLFCQTFFSDDFESYTVGQYLGSQSNIWTTSNEADGTIEDAKVVNEKSASGSKAIFFESISTSGGPQSVVLPFTDRYIDGVFEMGIKLFIPSNKSAHFYLHGEKDLGQTWSKSIEVYFNSDNSIYLIEGGNVITFSTYPHNTWFEFVIKGNITSNVWTAYIDNKQLGTFKLSSNKVASLIIHPEEYISTYYIDDVYYKHHQYLQKENDVAIISTNISDNDLTGYKSELALELLNLGKSTINQTDIEVKYGGMVFNESFTNLSIETMKRKIIKIDRKLDVLPNSNTLEIKVSLSQNADEDTSNNNIYKNIYGYTPAEDKVVVAEDYTATWCGLCPMGISSLDKLSKKYINHFIGIAVHNNDPMSSQEYSEGLNSIDASVGLSTAIDRDYVSTPLSVADFDFFQYAIRTPITQIKKIGTEYDANSRILKVSALIKFKSVINNKKYKMAIVLVEDSIRGTSQGYNQVNYFADGINSDMGGFELLPPVVPANIMIYNHVARLIIGGFDGTFFPKNSYKKDEETIINFETELPVGLNLKNVKIIAIIFNTNSRIDNAYKVKYEDALIEGVISGNKDVIINRDVKLYPNPFALTSIVELELDNSVDVSIEIFDASGKMVGNKNYGKLSGKQELVINGNLLQNGTYFASIRAGEDQISKTIVIQK